MKLLDEAEKFVREQGFPIHRGTRFCFDRRYSGLANCCKNCESLTGCMMSKKLAEHAQQIALNFPGVNPKIFVEVIRKEGQRVVEAERSKQDVLSIKTE